MKINKWYILLFSYTFVLGYSLSYKPPYMISAPIAISATPTIQRWPEPEIEIESWVNANNIIIHNNIFISTTTNFKANAKD